MKPAFALAIALMLLTMGVRSRGAASDRSGFWETDDDEGQPQAWFFFEEKEKDGPWVGHLVKGFKKPGEKFVDTCTKCTWRPEELAKDARPRDGQRHEA